MTCDASTQVACYRKGQLKLCRPRLSLPSRFLPLPPQQATVIPPSLAAADSSSSVYNHTGSDTHIHQPIVAPPAIRVDDAIEGYLAPNRGP